MAPSGGEPDGGQTTGSSDARYGRREARPRPERKDMHVVQKAAQRAHESRLEIEPRAPFRLDLTAWALRRRPHNAIDDWRPPVYRRVVSLDGGPVALSVTQEGLAEMPRLSTLLAGRAIERSA